MRNFVAVLMVLLLFAGASGLIAGDSKQVGPAIALTYENDKLMDGAGAQLQRIYGIYALSRYFHVAYIHTPLKQIGYQGLSALEENRLSHNAEEKWNRVFVIPSDLEPPQDAVTEVIDAPKAEVIETLKTGAQKENKFYILRILLPYEVTDRNPEIYQCLKDISPFHPARSQTFRLAIHVRRGDEFAVASERMLPNSYYVATAMRIVEALKTQNIPFVCELYTEVATKPFIVTQSTVGFQGKIAHPVLIDPKMNGLEDFDVIPNLHKYINTDPIESLKGMATADALIISRSSFSYFAALFNKGIVIYFPFWHKPLKEWLTSDINGNISDEGMSKQLKSWKDAHR